MKETLRILHLEDSECDAELVQKILKTADLECSIVVTKTRGDYERALEEGQFGLIMSGLFPLPGFDGLSAPQLARKKHPPVPFIFVSGTIGEEQAVESLKRGATDYVIKDRLTRLVPAILRALAEAEAAKKRLRSEEQIREQAALLDQAQDAICLNDMEQHILYWNKSAERLYGWSAKEALGRNANELLFQGNLTGPQAALKSLIRKGEWQGELNQDTRGETRNTVESRWTLMRDHAGEPKSILIINTDITGKKQIEAQLLRTQRMETIGALAGGIAHDLNNALSPILMVMNLVRDELTTEDSRRLLEIMQISARRSAEMVKQILSFARGVGGEHAVLQLSHLIEEMAKLSRDTFPRSIRIETKIPRQLYPIMGNATQLNQVLLNLCVNARDAMPNGGWLRIEAENVTLDEAQASQRRQPAGRYVLLSVIDTGHGMSADIIGKIFEPFFTTKEAGKGTGLGLSTVMGIVKTHDGFVEVSSDPGNGTTFRIYLPATGKDELGDGGQEPPRPPAGNGELLLLVDDETAILEVTRALLESFNYKVVTAKDGAEAVETYRRRQEEIKLVITDMMMPVMNGPDAIRAMRQIKPDVKVIGVSGLSSESSLVKANPPLVQAFLKKPFANEDLLAAVHRLLAKSLSP